MGKKSGIGSGIRDEKPGSNFLVKILNFFDAYRYLGSGLEKNRTRDGKIRIRNKHPGSATLLLT
jgi:hypothetical protein